MCVRAHRNTHIHTHAPAPAGQQISDGQNTVRKNYIKPIAPRGSLDSVLLRRFGRGVRLGKSARA